VLFNEASETDRRGSVNFRRDGRDDVIVGNDSTG